LFTQVAPDIAVFGEKDWQQLAIIARMTADLDLPVEIVGVSIQREADGLALSSRNAYLSADERRAATALPRALDQAAQKIASGGLIKDALDVATEQMKMAGFQSVDYVALVDGATLQPVTKLTDSARLLAAARIGKTRLIDNLAVTPS
jgi:pantoate--beta-alanine ligase